MATPTPAVNSSSAPSAPAGVPVNAPTTTPVPHAQDSMEMREPVNATNAGYCSSICSTISSILRSIKTKILQFIHYFFPRETANRPEFFTTTLSAIQDPAQSCPRKLDSFSDFISNRQRHLQEHPSDSDLNMMNRCLYEVLAALPNDLAGAIIRKALQLSNYPIGPGDRFQVSISNQDHSLVSVRRLQEAADSLRQLYPDCVFTNQLIVISDGNASDRAKIEALKALVNFNLDVRFDRFNLHSTETEESWKTLLRDAIRELPENVKNVLFQKMGQHSQPRDGRMAFLANPRSPEAIQAIEETLQTIRPEFFTSTLSAIQDPAQNYQKKLQHLAHFFSCRFTYLADHPADRNMLDTCTQELFAALPSSLAEAVICKTLQLRNSPTAHPERSEDRIAISVPNQENTALSQYLINGAIHALIHLYPDVFFTDQFIIMSDPHASLRRQMEALKALVDFDLDVRFDDRFDLHSTMTEEGWKPILRDLIQELPEEIKRQLFERMWNLVQPRDGRETFLENPRSPEARQAVEETLQAFPNA